jgi:hypothetical protein
MTASPKTRKPARTLAEKIADADAMGSNWLYRANLAAERGEKEKAERMYAKVQKWLDLSNKLRGDA